MKQETQQQTASTTTSQKVVSQQAQKSSASAIDKLKEFGGFAFLENIIDGYSNLNPARKAPVATSSSRMNSGKMNVRPWLIA